MTPDLFDGLDAPALPATQPLAPGAVLLRGFMWGLFGFVAFFIALVVALVHAEPWTAYGLAWLAALLVALAVYAWRGRWLRAGPRAVREP